MRSRTLGQQYRSEIESWDWRAIVREARDDADEAEDGEGRAFLGTVTTLYPSGKYWTAYACSNLAPCPRCRGRGRVRGKLGRRWARLRRRNARWTRRAKLHAAGLERLGLSFQEAWSRACRALGAAPILTRLRDRGDQCPRCEGLGSDEALEDEVFGHALDEVAEAHGGSVSGGEGDPVDLFFVCHVDREEEVEA